MVLAGSKNIFKVVRQIMYEPLHHNSGIVVDLEGPRPPKDTGVWAGLGNRM